VENAVCIPLNRGRYTLISAEDYELISKYKWYAVCNRKKWYAVTYFRENKKPITLRMHQIILGIRGKEIIGDHINGKSLDNRRSNIRKATYRGNAMNVGIRSNNKTGYKGVSFVQNRFRANIAADGKQIFIGGFETAEEAALAYDAAAKILHGEFAWYNFPHLVV